MDMYADNNGGFQVVEGTTPFEESYQIQEAESLPVAPYQETAAETAWYGDTEGAENLPVAPYQETAVEYEADTYMEEAEVLPVEQEQETVSEMVGVEPEEQTAALKTTETEPEQAAPVVDGEDDEQRKRAEHEAAEAKRKAEWEAKQQSKKAVEQEKLDQLANMSDDDAVSAAMKRVGADTEKLTRRNMKDCVAEYIQTRCLEDAELARMVMHPRKSMIHCFHYINRKAREFVEQEMEDNDIKPENGVYGSDVPDDLCYQWAEDYFRDPDAEEDEVVEEKFVPKPYISSSGYKAKSKKSVKKKETVKPQKAEKETKVENADGENYGQMSFMDTLMPSSQSVSEQKVG